jgi:hypothetical protein
LRALLADTKLTWEARAEVALGLARLGDDSGLSLWASKAGLTRSEAQRRKSKLEHLVHAAAEPVDEKAQKLLDGTWSDSPEVRSR